jgi:hypothetical protein
MPVAAVGQYFRLPLLSVMVPELAKTARWDLPECPLLGTHLAELNFR